LFNGERTLPTTGTGTVEGTGAAEGTGIPELDKLSRKYCGGLIVALPPIESPIVV